MKKDARIFFGIETAIATAQAYELCNMAIRAPVLTQTAEKSPDRGTNGLQSKGADIALRA